MLRRYLLPFLAVLGFSFAMFMVAKGDKTLPPAKPAAMPPVVAMESYVSGAGLIEAAGENIAIGTPVPGIVTQIPVKVGDSVNPGDLLFQIDNRSLQSQHLQQLAAVQVAQAQLARLKAMPRPEDLPPLQAIIAQRRADLADAQTRLARWEAVKDSRAVSQDELEKHRAAVLITQAALAQAQADFDRAKAGAWQEDITVAQAQLASAQAALDATDVELSRLQVRAPIAGKILKINIRPGEYASAGTPASSPLLVLGNVSSFHVRVDIDENDAWRIQPNASAIGYARGNRNIQTPLQFVRFEPLVTPKKSLTGDSTERVDTRVLQIIYSFNPANLPLYIGQQMDIFIAAPSATGAITTQKGPQP